MLRSIQHLQYLLYGNVVVQNEKQVIIIPHHIKTPPPAQPSAVVVNKKSKRSVRINEAPPQERVISDVQVFNPHQIAFFKRRCVEQQRDDRDSEDVNSVLRKIAKKQVRAEGEFYDYDAFAIIENRKKDAMSKFHFLVVPKEYDDDVSFNVVFSKPSEHVVSYLRNMRLVALEFLRQQYPYIDVLKTIGFFFHMYPDASEHWLHMHIIDMTELTIRGQKMQNHNLGLNNCISVLEWESTRTDEEKKRHCETEFKQGNGHASE